MGTAAVLPEGLSVDRARLAEVCERFGVAELSVFGSVARGDATAESDVDLLYVLVPGARLGFALNRLEDELAELFGRRVDLVSRKALHPLLREDVTNEARTLYAA
jgi:predicted nucleotidyltransferase